MNVENRLYSIDHLHKLKIKIFYQKILLNFFFITQNNENMSPENVWKGMIITDTLR